MSDDEDDGGAFVPPFELHNSMRLRWRGIGGKRVSVGLGEGAVYVASRKGKVLTVPLDEVERVLVGCEPMRSSTRHRLELRTAQGAVVLHANGRIDSMDHYVALVRGIAQEMARRGRLDAVRIGMPKLYVFGTPLLVGALLAGVTWMATDEATLRATPKEDFLMGGAVLLGIIAVIGGGSFRQGFHRRVGTIADLDRFLGVA